MGNSTLPARLREEYEYLRELGSGGFGRVVLVRHVQNGAQYALKLLQEKAPDNLQRFIGKPSSYRRTSTTRSPESTRHL